MPWEEALSSSSAIFGVQTWVTGLNRQKNWGQGTKVCTVEQSQWQVCSGWPLSQSKGSQRGSRKDVITAITWGEPSDSHGMTAPAPWCSLIITSNCPHLDIRSFRGDLTCTFHCSLWEVWVPCHEDVISSVLSGIQGDCKVTIKRMA
jgi:hypothetical protein